MADKLANTNNVLIEHIDGELVYENVAERKAREKAVARLDLLYDRRRFLGKLLICGLTLFLIIALLIPSKYTSTVQLMPPDQQASSGIAALAALAGRAGGAGVLTGLAGDVLGLKTSGDLFIGVLGSRTVRDDLINKFDLRALYKAKRWESARRTLAGRTVITQDKKSGIITIAVTDRSPERAAAMGAEYVNQLNWVMTQLNTSSAHRERVFLEDRLVQVKQDLENAEKGFSQFASKNEALDIPEQGKAMVEASSVLEGQLIAAETELQGLKQIYTDNNVRVRSVQARIDELRVQLEKLRGKAGSGDDIATDSDSLYPSIRKLPLLGVTYTDLLRATKVQETVFEALTQEYELAKVQEAKEIPSVKVLDPPDVPEKKSSPHRAIITGFGGALFLGTGIAWILGTNRWKQTDDRDPAKFFTRRVFGDISRALPWPSRKQSVAASSGWDVPSRNADDCDKEKYNGDLNGSSNGNS
jgi:capsule polysaccharide export protein KpsE/RkpR